MFGMGLNQSFELIQSLCYIVIPVISEMDVCFALKIIQLAIASCITQFFSNIKNTD